MKNHLPKDHNLPKSILTSPMIHIANGTPNVTDAQYAALEAGVASGASLLLVAPTSSGKTEVGLIGIACWLLKEPMKHRAVYLVSHRALARQKFNQLKATGYLQAMGLAANEIAMSNGDISISGDGQIPDDPLAARFLVATYEKFLALLAGSGLRQDMSHYVVVADEFQLIADRTRGQDLEVLFTVMRLARVGQFIGLSAVLEKRDSEVLADWTEAKQIIVNTREVPLEYQLRIPTATYLWRTDGPEEPQEVEPRPAREIVDILVELEADAGANFPVAVFCMTKADVETHARAWAAVRGVDGAKDRLQADLFEEPTALSEALAIYMPHGFGIHTADLIEGERELVEQALDKDGLAVVFATTTLAQGLNYSFKTVILSRWVRWNDARKQREPIDQSEFHNIAGRAGRLGKVGERHGQVLFCANSYAEQVAARKYLSTDMESRVVGQIDLERLDHVTLQLLSAGLCRTQDDLLWFLKASLSGHLAQKAGKNQEEVWREKLAAAVASLDQYGFVLA